MVTSKEKKVLKKLYEGQQVTIIQSLNNSEMLTEVDTSGDAIDEIQGEFLIRLQKNLSERDLFKLRRIQSSLKKIDKSSFGKCDECEEDINFDRLKAIPGVSLCICCAQKAENEQYNKTRTRY